MENLNFAEFFNVRVKERGLNLKKLSEISGITTKYLEGISAGNFTNLPASPYFRGYLIKLGRILEFDPEIWWTKLKEGGFVKDSGGHDLPAKNRFVKSSFLKLAWIAVIALIVLLYLFFQFARIFGRPLLTVTYPPQNPTVAQASQLTLAGTAKNTDGLYVNGEVTSVAKDGAWEKTILLQSGINSIEIRAKKFLGGETKIVEQIIYESSTTLPATSP